jgi:hypothetical protein
VKNKKLMFMLTIAGVFAVCFAWYRVYQLDEERGGHELQVADYYKEPSK